jgi:hypothetical protein
MFRAVPLPIIRSPLTVHLALVYITRFEDSFRAGLGWNCSGLVLKALRYKPAGRGFDSQWCNWNFAVT